MRSRLRNLLLSFLLMAPAWADTGGSTTTLTIDPSAVSGSTITASDVNNRSNDVSTWANAHAHSLSNTTSFGDGAAGNKSLCADAADGTDACIRWNDTANLWTVDNPTPGTFNMIVTESGTSGLTSNTILVADGTSSIKSFTTVAPSDDQLLVPDSASAGTWRTVPNCTDTGGNHLNYTQSSNSFSCGTSGAFSSTVLTFSRTAAAGSGAQAVTGAGFQPTGLDMVCQDGNLLLSWGFGGANASENHTRIQSTTSTNSDDTNIVAVNAGGADFMNAVLTSMDADGFTVTWTKGGAGKDVTCKVLATGG